MDMVEKVALALAEADHLGATYEDMAKAAIEAMREPTEAMLDAVTEAEKAHDYDWSAGQFMSAEDGWPIMIDAALKEQEKVG